jgi:unsaturated chondroitin disaccharide hydrolase
MQRYNRKGAFLQAWGPPDAEAEIRGRAIVDTMMNLDLLFWASEETKDPSFADAAKAHARTCLKYQVRYDFSTSHVIDFNPDTGEFIKQDTHQGLSPTSCWSRGQSWAVYGFGDCYRASKDITFLETARSLAQYGLERLPADLVPYWDYDSPKIPDDVRDSSAAAILASGLVNLASLERDEVLSKRWKTEAGRILESLWQNYSSRDTDERGILLHSTRSVPHNMMDHGLIYGDYYFVEALLGYKEDPIWDE